MDEKIILTRDLYIGGGLWAAAGDVLTVTRPEAARLITDGAAVPMVKELDVKSESKSDAKRK